MALKSSKTGSNIPNTNITGYDTRHIQNFTPEQLNLLESLIPANQKGAVAGTDFLSRLASGDENIFKEIEAPAHEKFQEFLGEAGSKFGHLGATGSSGFQNLISGESSRMAQDLASQRTGLRTKAIESLLSQSKNLIGERPYENVLLPQKQKMDYGKLVGEYGPQVANLILDFFEKSEKKKNKDVSELLGPFDEETGQEGEQSDFWGTASKWAKPILALLQAIFGSEGNNPTGQGPNISVSGNRANMGYKF